MEFNAAGHAVNVNSIVEIGTPQGIPLYFFLYKKLSEKNPVFMALPVKRDGEGFSLYPVDSGLQNSIRMEQVEGKDVSFLVSDVYHLGKKDAKLIKQLGEWTETVAKRRALTSDIRSRIKADKLTEGNPKSLNAEKSGCRKKPYDPSQDAFAGQNNGHKTTIVNSMSMKFNTSRIVDVPLKTLAKFNLLDSECLAILRGGATDDEDSRPLRYKDGVEDPNDSTLVDTYYHTLNDVLSDLVSRVPEKEGKSTREVNAERIEHLCDLEGMNEEMASSLYKNLEKLRVNFSRIEGKPVSGVHWKSVFYAATKTGDLVTEKPELVS